MAILPRKGRPTDIKISVLPVSHSKLCVRHQFPTCIIEGVRTDPTDISAEIRKLTFILLSHDFWHIGVSFKVVLYVWVM